MYIHFMYNIMKLVKLDATHDTPSVVLDPEQNLVNISGRSLPENVNTFYEPILRWLDDYTSLHSPNTVVEFKLNYFSTSSSKMLLSILHKLESIQSQGSNVQVKWYYPQNNQDIEEAGEIYSELVNLPFEYIQYKHS